MSRLVCGLLLLALPAAVCVDARFTAAQTLADTLRDRSIPVGSPPIQNANARITSFAELNNPADYLIAYYVDDGSGSLKPPLYIARYLKDSGAWHTAGLTDIKASFHDTQVDCLGSALEIQRAGDYFFVDTHLTPSAGCVLVLNSDLTLKKSLCGWFLAAFRSGLLVYHKSEVHFAVTHPMEIAIYDLGTGRETQIYPPSRDAIRHEYEERIRRLMPGEDWCREHNSPCDPAEFSSELSEKVALNERTHSLAFVAQFDALGLIPREAANRSPELNMKAVYVFRLGPGPIRHCEFWFDDLKNRYGLNSVDELLTPAKIRELFSSQRR
jgi:hypothetical protein